MSSRTGPLGRNYTKLWTASVISNLGDGLALVAYPWLASAITRNPIHLAGIAVATRLPWALFTLPAGVITDRVDRRRLIALMDSFRFLLTLGVAIIIGLAASQFPDPGALAAGEAVAPAGATAYLVVLYVSALLLGSAEVLRDNSAQTLMPSLVDSDQLERANGRLWGSEMVMNSFVGPPLAGALIAVALALPIFVDAATFAVSAYLIFLIKGDFRPRQEIRADDGGGRIAWWSEIKEGFGWLWRHPLLRSLALILGVLNGLSMMTLATFVFFSQEVLGLSAAQFGLLLTGAAAGGVAGTFAGARISEKLGSGTSLLVAITVMTLQFGITGFASSAIVVWIALAIGVMWGMVWNVITVSLRQQIIPDRLLGRVNSVYRLFGWGMMPIGSLIGGAVVAVTEQFASREVALRAPYFVATAVMVAVFFVAISRLNTTQLEAARATQPGSAETSSSDPSSPTSSG